MTYNLYYNGKHLHSWKMIETWSISDLESLVELYVAESGLDREMDYDSDLLEIRAEIEISLEELQLNGAWNKEDSKELGERALHILSPL